MSSDEPRSSDLRDRLDQEFPLFSTPPAARHAALETDISLPIHLAREVGNLARRISEGMILRESVLLLEYPSIPAY